MQLSLTAFVCLATSSDVIIMMSSAANGRHRCVVCNAEYSSYSVMQVCIRKHVRCLTASLNSHH